MTAALRFFIANIDDDLVSTCKENGLDIDMVALDSVESKLAEMNEDNQ